MLTPAGEDRGSFMSLLDKESSDRTIAHSRSVFVQLTELELRTSYDSPRFSVLTYSQLANSSSLAC